MPEYLPIAEHGIMGDLHTVALTGTDGTIDWYCCPSFDSPSVFASILDREKGGYYRISPVTDGSTAKQLYFPDTNVLITRFLTPDGVGEIQGFMPIEDSGVEVHRHRLIRRVEGVRGEMRFRVEMFPRFNYGRDEHEIEQFEHGVVFRSPGLCLALQATTPVASEAGGIHCEFTVRAGSSVTFVLERVEPDYVPREYSEAETRRAYEETIAFWRNWVGRSHYRGRWREVVNRSALTLKLLTYRPTGAIVAAPTTSLPEQIGGGRNWDYRYTWIRDAAFTVFALRRIGFGTEADAFLGWVLDAFEQSGQPRIMYDLDGSPVRWGNGAADQRQHDVYGEILDCAD
jgi:GH15 family glucan-1,4-alpha-glucosidase